MRRPVRSFPSVEVDARRRLWAPLGSRNVRDIAPRHGRAAVTEGSARSGRLFWGIARHEDAHQIGHTKSAAAIARSQSPARNRAQHSATWAHCETATACGGLSKFKRPRSALLSETHVPITLRTPSDLQGSRPAPPGPIGSPRTRVRDTSHGARLPRSGFASRRALALPGLCALRSALGARQLVARVAFGVSARNHAQRMVTPHMSSCVSNASDLLCINAEVVTRSRHVRIWS